MAVCRIVLQITDEIKKKTDNIISLNFEDKRVSANIADGQALIAYVENIEKRETFAISSIDVATLRSNVNFCLGKSIWIIF